MLNALELENVNKQYRDFSLKNVSFTLPGGCIMGFIGENGAGKTTTIKAILNLISRDTGEIRIWGHDNIREERLAKSDVGVVLDAACFPPDFHAGNLRKVLRNSYAQWDDALFSRYEKEFALPATKKIKEYSKGMLMKLFIAAALSHHPRLLILDEATSGLDPVMRNEILDILLDFIQDEDHSILLSSHITSDLEKIADYITFIHSGRILFCESKDELLQRYGLLKCGKDEFSKLDKSFFDGYRESAFGVEALVKNRGDFCARHHGLTVDSISIDDIMVFHGKNAGKSNFE